MIVYAKRTFLCVLAFSVAVGLHSETFPTKATPLVTTAWDWLPYASWSEGSWEALAEHYAVHTVAQHFDMSLLQLFRNSLVTHDGSAKIKRSSVSGDADGNVAVAPAVAANGTSDVAALAATSSGQSVATASKQKLSWSAWLYLTFSFTFVLKSLCMISNMTYQVAPIPHVQKFHKRQNTGDADSAPFITMLYGSMQWSFYGCFAYFVTGKSGFLVLVYSNVFGCVLGSYYVYGFLMNCKSERSLQRLSFYYRLMSVFVLMQICAIMTSETVNALFFVGLVSSICSIMGAGSLLTTLPQVIETQCSASINLPLLVTGVLSCSLWLVCGIVLHDIWILGPNVVGLLFQSVATAAVLYFPRQVKAKAETDTKAKTHGAQGLLPSPSAPKMAGHWNDEEAAIVPRPVLVQNTPESISGCCDGGRSMSSQYGTMEQPQQVQHQQSHQQQQQQQQSHGETGGT